MEQHQPGIYSLRDDFADKWLWSLLPPALSQLQGDSQGDSGRAEGNPRKMRRSNSEGSLLPMEKQNQPRASKKVRKEMWVGWFNISMPPLTFFLNNPKFFMKKSDEKWEILHCYKKHMDTQQRIKSHGTKVETDTEIILVQRAKGSTSSPWVSLD